MIAEHRRTPRFTVSTTVAMTVAVAVTVALLRSGSLTNPSGFGSFGAFWSAALDPASSPAFLRRMASASATTASFALLGTLLALVLGLMFAPVLAHVSWDLDRLPAGPNRTVGRGLLRSVRAAAVLPRSIHEFVFALVLIQVLGLDPIVAIVSIGVPFGAVTAKVFADLLDGAAPEATNALRAAGAPRQVAVLAAAAPTASRDLLSYAFYRFECAMRSAAVLGIIGAGGLGYELALSFESLRYDEVWTAIWALVLLSGIADRWSSFVRQAERRGSSPAGRSERKPRHTSVIPRSPAVRSALLLFAFSPLAWWWVHPEPQRLWSGQTRSLAADLAERAWPPAFGDLGLRGLVLDSVDTFIISVLAMVLAVTGASAMAFASGGGLRAVDGHPTPATRLVEFFARSLLLVLRAVPPPVWAFVVVLVLLPGIVPGAVALGLYNLGVLGRLMAEVLENDSDGASPALRAAGSPSGVAFLTGALPAVWPRWQGLVFYRWEVTIRDTVMIGAAGATGLGRTIVLDLAGRAFDRAFAALLALLIVTFVVDEPPARVGVLVTTSWLAERSAPAAPAGVPGPNTVALPGDDGGFVLLGVGGSMGLEHAVSSGVAIGGPARGEELIGAAGTGATVGRLIVATRLTTTDLEQDRRHVDTVSGIDPTSRARR